MDVAAQRLGGSHGARASDGPIPPGHPKGPAWGLCGAQWRGFVCMRPPHQHCSPGCCLASHQQEPVLPVSDLSVQNIPESPAQLQSHKGRGLSSHLYHYRSDKGFGISWQETSRQQFWEQPLLLSHQAYWFSLSKHRFYLFS